MSKSNRSAPHVLVRKVHHHDDSGVAKVRLPLAAASSGHKFDSKKRKKKTKTSSQSFMQESNGDQTPTPAPDYVHQLNRPMSPPSVARKKSS